MENKGKEGRRVRGVGGSFNNYVDQVLPNFDPSPSSTIVDILHDASPFSRDQGICLSDWDFQKKIVLSTGSNRYAVSLLTLNSTFGFSRVFCFCFATVYSSSFLLILRKFRTFKFKIVVWHIFLSPIEFSKNKRPLLTLSLSSCPRSYWMIPSRVVKWEETKNRVMNHCNSSSRCLLQFYFTLWSYYLLPTTHHCDRKFQLLSKNSLFWGLLVKYVFIEIRSTYLRCLF